MLAGAVVVALLSVSCREATPARAPETPKPELFLMTALPLVWSEDFGLDQPGSPALKALEQVYRVTAIDLPSQLPDGALLLAAQPRALPAEELVALDEWVRAGGRMVLLADPVLEWPSELPLGDKRRAPLGYTDTGLLQRWGLRLDAPEHRGFRRIRDGDLEVLYTSPGTLVRLDEACRIARGGVAADCSIGRGRVVAVADADWLNFDAVERAGDRTQQNEFALLVLVSGLLNEQERKSLTR